MVICDTKREVLGSVLQIPLAHFFLTVYNGNKHSRTEAESMSEETIKNVGTVTVKINAEWPEDDRKELQQKIDEFNAALDAANEKADALMEKMKQMQEISLSLSEERP